MRARVGSSERDLASILPRSPINRQVQGHIRGQFAIGGRRPSRSHQFLVAERCEDVDATCCSHANGAVGTIRTELPRTLDHDAVA